jgi:hypothetical protein
VLIQPMDVDPMGLRAVHRIEAPVETVASYVGDLANMRTWWPEHPVYRRLYGDGGAGSLYAWIYVVRGVPVAGVSRVLARDAQRFEYRAGPPGVGVRFAYRFEPDGRATRLRASCSTFFARLPGFAAHFVPEVTRALDRLADRRWD